MTSEKADEGMIRAFARVVAQELNEEELQLISGAGSTGTDCGSECDPDGSEG